MALEARDGEGECVNGARLKEKLRGKHSRTGTELILEWCEGKGSEGQGNGGKGKEGKRR